MSLTKTKYHIRNIDVRNGHGKVLKQEPILCTQQFVWDVDDKSIIFGNPIEFLSASDIIVERLNVLS